MTSASAIAQLGHFIADTRYEDLPPAIVVKARRHILDTIGAGLAGATSTEASLVRAMLDADGPGRTVVWGTGARATPRNAALVNGVASHAFELDDTGGCDHSGAVVVPAALAALDVTEHPVSGHDLITAVVIGYDLGRRVLEAFGGYAPHNAAGWHSTGTCGSFAAAAAAANLLRLDPAHAAASLGLAASFSGGLWAFIHDGSQAKRIHAGRAAEGGLLAALLARQGVTGPGRVFDDVWGGFLRSYAHGPTDPAALLRELGSNWKIADAAIKPYASCRGTHTSIDAIGKLMADHALEHQDIRGVRIRMSSFLHGMCGGRHVAGLPGAQMSLPYAVTARMVLGHVGLAAFAPAQRGDPRIHDAMARIVLIEDPAMAPADEPFVTLTTVAGHIFEEHVAVPLGAPRNPVSDTALLAKFQELATLTLTTDRARLLAEAVLGLDDIADARTLSDLLAPS
jgi:2-methylcitrate dehydratase PrpD